MYREEVAQELESLRQKLVEYKYCIKIIEGKIAAAEAILQSDLLDDPAISTTQEIEKVLHTDENSVYNATTEQQ
jgi:hypothetical protein